MRLGFDRCWALDDGTEPVRPSFLEPLMFARLATALVVLAMLMLATPFWHSTPVAPVPTEARQAQTNTVELSSSRFLVP